MSCSENVLNNNLNSSKRFKSMSVKDLLFFLLLSEQSVAYFPTWDSVQFSRSVVSNSLWHHGLQQARLPCPSPTPRACSNSCPSSQWCHPTISSSVIPFSSWPQSFQASGSFQMSQLFASGGQSIGVSASTSVLPINNQDWFPLGLTGLILHSKGFSRVFSNTIVEKHQFFGAQLSLWASLIAQLVKNLPAVQET